MLDQNILGIYYFETDRVLDSYVEVFLQALTACTTDLVIVCATHLTGEAYQGLRRFTERIIRADGITGLLHAYKIGLSVLDAPISSYHKIICCASTLMGPVHALSPLLKRMDESYWDYWGLCCVQDAATGQRVLPADFLVFQPSATESGLLAEFWNFFTEPQRMKTDVLPLHIEALQGSALVDADHYFQYTQNPLLEYPADLVARHGCPFFLRETFTRDYRDTLEYSAGTSAYALFRYLRESEYDVDALWDYLLRTQHQADIAKTLHLENILPDDCLTPAGAKAGGQRVALIIHVYFLDLLDDMLRYARSMPEDTDVYITTHTREKKAKIEEAFAGLPAGKLDVRIIENRGRDVSSVLLGVKDVILSYDVACFIHDKKSDYYSPGQVGESFARLMLENLLGSPAYVQNVLGLFSENPRLGLLSPPQPNHSYLFPVTGFDWGYNYEATVQLASRLGITVPMCHDKEPVAPFGTCFWFRPAAFAPAYEYDLSYKDFPKEPNNLDATILHAFERLYPFIAQQAGYFSAFAMTTAYAAVEETNLKDYLRRFNSIVKEYSCFGPPAVVYGTLRHQLEALAQLQQHTPEVYGALEGVRRQAQAQDEVIAVKDQIIEDLRPYVSLKYHLRTRMRRLLRKTPNQ